MSAFDATGLENIVRVIQSSLTPIFLLTAVASLLSVFTTRLARISDQVHTLSETTAASDAENRLIARRLEFSSEWFR